MKREPAFLLAAARRFLRPDSPLPNSDGLDWRLLVSLAAAHTVTPQLYLAAREGAAPPEIAAGLRESFESAARFNLALAAELARLLKSCEQEGIAAVPLKGPALAAALYGNLALRASSDLDLLIRPADLARVRRILAARGYRLTSNLHWNSERACFRARERQVSFLDAAGIISVDVHWHPMPAYFPDSFSPEEAWGSLQPVRMAGFPVRALAPRHLLLYLCGHGGKHGWERLAWICDLARLIELDPELDWEAAMGEARRARTGRMLATGLLLASDLLGKNLPAPAARFVSADPHARALADDVWARYEAGARIPTPAVDMTAFCTRLLERPSHKFRLVFGTWIGPSEAEYRVLKLPPPLFVLYYAFRPLRLLWRRLLGRSRR